MKELTKPQKIKVIDKMILLLKRSTKRGLCYTYERACDLLKHNIDTESLVIWTPRFIELNNAITSEIKRAGGPAYIHYDNWIDDRINLLKKVKKQL